MRGPGHAQMQRHLSSHGPEGRPSSFLLLLVRHLLLVAMPFAPSSILVPSSKARSP